MDARRPTIAIGEVRARVHGADRAMEATLRTLVSQEIARLDVDHVRHADSYVFSASLVRMDAESSRQGSRASCVVSGVLRRAHEGALLAVTRGSGLVEDERFLDVAKEQALEAAVHGAVKRVPDAL